ncbi:phenylacetic acid degradation protein [Streptomyces agglomeratus]|uniref:Phenylacetic acid degradation protein n=1 Tax=Streptomyces agglomeratus TaxID=285458 RepID=A0A1E5P8V5_9ACTN|nr:2Fe-2S iron-sulfur cluster-binding protein [Streptomyces agglomeratus]OEJ25991.1 phenylacetic acid degradation protein [Streptomyces agglomeratus]OEJ39953.1 phenylacetic acid degradation protein [Streptomyces agglomeratus]OEJ45666.1 phenylacetic acid degradation protein [Streptomyces agglomeratus]OEJ52501.1 phenylacetic acid degradation protein [Streptomyces agglomeratus]OEJ59873.1 phenylacetic acid degradation protein [Streptomyces agglomeratus]
MLSSDAGRAGFHPLRVREVERLTDDSVAVTLAVPPELRETFRHTPGQHIALRRVVAGEEIRRTYSICAPATEAPREPVLRVGIRLVDGGDFSTYALKELAVGDTVEAMAPAGRFVLEPRPGRFAAVVGGSGITPVLSMASTLLAREPDATFCLLRSDRTAASTMFLEEVADLKDRYPDRFQLVTALSREEQQAGLPSGRLDEERLTRLLPALLPVADVDGWFLCGPFGLVQGAERALRGLGVARNRIHEEIFHVDDGTGTVTSSPVAAPASSTLTATLDGRSGNWPVLDGESLLETVLRSRADAPYACKGGVCGTCRAFLVSGEVRMDRNYALEPEETDAGYVLACQSHPATPEVELDFDR